MTINSTSVLAERNNFEFTPQTIGNHLLGLCMPLVASLANIGGRLRYAVFSAFNSCAIDSLTDKLIS